MEKLLLEACLEVMQTDALVGIQDMGAAGLTCSTTEMGSRGGAGIEIDVSLVPQRETGMTPYEIMLSESQERMLLVVKRGREAEVERIFEKWDLHAVRIGEVTTDGLLRVKDHGDRRRRDSEPRADRRGAGLSPADGGARRTRRGAAARSRGRCRRRRLGRRQTALLTLLGSPTIASKRWVYRQYDHMVRTNTINLPGLGAGVVRIKGTDRALAMSVDGNGRYCYLDPYRGAMLAVAEAARNVACAGARPLGATNCLNFGNPERPAIMWQFAQAVEGIGAACRALDVPITGGNVSLYNETDGRAIYPTPVIGVVGLLEHADRVRRPAVPRRGRRGRAARRGQGRARRQRIPEGRARPGPRRAADARSGRRARAAGAARGAGRRAADPLGARLLGRRPRGDARRVLLRHRRRSAWRRRLTPCSVAATLRVNVAAALFGESASRVVVSVVAGSGR